MGHPHITQSDRDAIEDRGVVDDDNTGMLEPPEVQLQGLLNHPNHR